MTIFSPMIRKAEILGELAEQARKDDQPNKAKQLEMKKNDILNFLLNVLNA